ncbi:MAG TPA: response regulator [Anaerohalosphaeraceae bacterium]|nr:response regulator [Anaerohalosphaeraceae bacterium]HPC64895.1 response regulator [Anaerohalosphaeraceae bacterium]HRS70420.1 response regulator [Anaerohalosphaeraceae bacterium]HRV20312.1 response regulator [Anaerohalosphaeraceae bacterium]
MAQEQQDKKDTPAADAMQKQIALQEAQFYAKGRLMNNMAYQIRTLSNAIVGFSDLLLSEPLSPDQLEYVREINQAGNGLSALVNEVLDWTQVMTGRIAVSKTSCDLAELLGRLEAILRSAAREKGLACAVQLDPQLPDSIVCDSEHLYKCLLNLLSNAVKYTRKGSIRIHVRLDDSQAEPAVCFDVIDTGIGIEADKIDSIFDPAQKREESNEQVQTLFNLGLTVTAGLSLTKQLCHLIGGTIEVTSQVNSGSTFTLRIPAGLELSTRQESPIYSHPKQETQKSASEPALILLAEDQPSNRTVITLMLEAMGVRVDTAQDGREAVQKALQNTYDLILMDLKMPTMDGYEAAAQIRRQNHVPMVALSAKVFDEDEHRRITALFEGFLTKPVDGRKLAQTLEQFIDSFQYSAPTAAASAGRPAENIAYEYRT